MQPVNSNIVKSEETNIVMSQKSESACLAVDAESGNVCGEKTGLQILNEFRKFYEERIQSIDINSDTGPQDKMNIMMEWIKDLDAQNTMLVSTVEELEEAACCRVKILEEQLKNTSSALTDNMQQHLKPSETILNSLYKKINQLEADEVLLQRKITNLHSDIRGLVELIRRAHKENRWDLEGIKFIEVNQHDIPIPNQSTFGQAMGDCKNIEILTQQSQLLSEREKKSIEYQHELQNKVMYLSEKLQNKEEKIQELMSNLEELKDCFKRRTEANADVKYDESLESREALAIEVAEKHDTAMNFKQQVNELEEIGRQLTMQLQFKENIIKNMRREMKLHKTKIASVSPKSPKKDHVNISHISQKVTWDDSVAKETTGELKVKNDSFLTALLELKSILANEHCVLKEKIQDLHDIWYHTTLMEKMNYDKYLTAGNSMVDEVLAMMEKYRERIIVNNEQGKSTTNGPFYCTDKLMKVIDALSDLCMNKNKRILEIEYVLQNACEKNNDVRQSSECDDKIRENCEITREQFNQMEEFRVCTVEAQAATEDLREEMDEVMCNLNYRNQLFVDLCNSIGIIRDVIARTKQNISSVIISVKAHVEKKIAGTDKIKLKQEKLKDMKNEINKVRSRFNSPINSEGDESDIYTRPIDIIMDEVGCIIDNFEIFINEEDCSIAILKDLRDQINSVETNMEKMQESTDRVLQENEAVQKEIHVKTEKLDKLQQELDYAHSTMQDILENIVFVSQQKESSNGHYCSTDDTSSINQSDERSQYSAFGIDQLKDSLYSKDKLLEHKDEIIRIQKDSMEMTQGEYKDLRQRLQSKINAQMDLINQCIQERIKLLDQNQLQNQTIKHLQDAVVEAKKNLNRQLPQKSTVDFGIGDGRNPITPSVFNNGSVHDV